MKKINLTFSLLILCTGIIVCVKVSWNFFSKIQFQHQLKQVTAVVVGLERNPMVPQELLKEQVFLPYNALIKYKYEISGKAYVYNNYVFENKEQYRNKNLPLLLDVILPTDRIGDTRIGSKRQYWYHPREPAVVLKDKENLMPTYLKLAFMIVLVIGLSISIHKVWRQLQGE